MPMNDNGYIWRPNDNSAKTNIRYSIEADKWVKAFEGAKMDNKKTGLGEVTGFIGLIFQLITTLLTGLILIIIKMFGGINLLIFGRKDKPVINKPNPYRYDDPKDDPWNDENGKFNYDDYEEIKL